MKVHHHGQGLHTGDVEAGDGQSQQHLVGREQIGDASRPTKRPVTGWG
jgi:hypothetical protein